jgi:hypothetical protein
VIGPPAVAGLPPAAAPVEPAGSVATDEAEADAGADLPVQPARDEARELGPVPQPAALVGQAPEVGKLDWRASFGFRSREACVKSLGDQEERCRMAFESRDPDWAPEAELRIREIVADMEFLRPIHDVHPGPVECFTTICQIVLDIDREALVAQLRSIGRYDGDLPPNRESAEVTRWVFDQLEEIHLALVVDGLVEEGAEASPGLLSPVLHDSSVPLAVLTVDRAPRVPKP